MTLIELLSISAIIFIDAIMFYAVGTAVYELIKQEISTMLKFGESESIEKKLEAEAVLKLKRLMIRLARLKLKCKHCNCHLELVDTFYKDKYVTLRCKRLYCYGRKSIQYATLDGKKLIAPGG